MHVCVVCVCVCVCVCMCMCICMHVCVFAVFILRGGGVGNFLLPPSS